MKNRLYQGSLLSPPLWQMQSQTLSPRVTVEVPRQLRLQARRYRKWLASSSPIRIHIEDDVHAGEVGCRKIELDINVYE